MHITLDEEQWQVSDESSLMEILATISDRAQAQHRMVTSLTIGGKAISDRDLAWYVAIHVVFVVSGLFLALTDRVAGKQAH